MTSDTQFLIRRSRKRVEGRASFSMNTAPLAVESQRIQIRLRPTEVEDERTVSINMSRKEALEWAGHLMRYGSMDIEGSTK